MSMAVQNSIIVKAEQFVSTGSASVPLATPGRRPVTTQNVSNEMVSQLHVTKSN